MPKRRSKRRGAAKLAESAAPQEEDDGLSPRERSYLHGASVFTSSLLISMLILSVFNYHKETLIPFVDKAALGGLYSTGNMVGIMIAVVFLGVVTGKTCKALLTALYKLKKRRSKKPTE